MHHESEIGVLGSILLKPELIDECYIRPEEFENEQHQLVMEYLRYSFDQDGTIDFEKMAGRSGKDLMQLGGFGFLMKLRDAVPGTALFDNYQQSIREQYKRRRAEEILRASALAAASEDGTASEVISKAQAALEEVAELKGGAATSGVRKMSDVLKGHNEELIKRSQQRGMTGAKTASVELDRFTGGHQNGDFEVIAARPSMGKTAFIICDMIETSRAGRPSALFSLEMPDRKVSERALCAIGHIDATKMRTGNMDDQDWERWSMAMDELDSLPIFIDDTPGMTVEYIAREVKRLKKLYPGIVIYIDFLQLLQSERRFTKDHERIAYVSKALKQIARRFDCPVIAISAVGRQCEQRQDKRPMMSDLRESGSIESDADIVIFLYRDDYYNRDSEKKNIVELIVAKGRNVGTGVIEMIFHKTWGKFLNIDRSKKAS